MKFSIATRYAFRSLRRNFRRTAISLLGLAFGVGLGLVAIAFIRGLEAMMVNASAGGGLGHLRLVPEGWNERRSDELRLASEWEPLLEEIRATPGVEVATPRASVGGLLGMGTRSAHVRLSGVDPSSEPDANRFVSDLVEGRYLREGETGAIVIGLATAERLRAERGDELVVTVVDREGELQSALLTVVGVASTGSRALDSTIAHVGLAEVERLSGREGVAEITITLADVDAIDSTRARLARGITGDAVLTWLEISPELRANLATRRTFMNLAVMLVLFVVLLGVASAQLTSVLDRRKEFAVLAALGTPGFQLVRIVLTEGALLGVASGLGALLWAGPLVRHWAVTGIDLGALMGEDGIDFGGILFDPIFRLDFGLWLIPMAVGLSVIATTLACIYPAVFASRTEAASALRVDQ